MRDVIVIGSGGGGAVVAKELAAQGLDVLVLEAGGHPQDTEKEWTHYETAAQARLRWGPSNPMQPAWQRENFAGGTLLQSSGVGGTTNLYFGNSPRAMPGAFAGYDGADKDMYDTGYLFPFSYNELRPYYHWVEKTLPVQTAAMGTKEEIFLSGAEAMGLTHMKTKDIHCDSYRPQENAILQPGGFAGLSDNEYLTSFPLAKGCTYCGHCMQGCYLPMKAPRNLKAKRSTYNSYVPMALTADMWSFCGKAAEIISDAFVTKVLTDESSSDMKATGVQFRISTTGELFEETAKVVVMACGAIETPRLWLNSGLPDPNGWVGKGLTNHATEVVVGVMPFETKSSYGPASAARVDFPGRGCLESFGATPGGEAALSFLGSYAGFAHMNGDDPTYREGRLVGAELKDVMSDMDRLLNVLVITDDDVDPSNAVMLSDTHAPDEHGAVPRVTGPGIANLTARTHANREFLTEKAIELVKAAGATKVIRAKTPPSMIHLQSSMRMGLDESNSVLDENCESRAVTGLYVADNSALANAIGGPNPTLTTQALATRTAEKIFKKHFGGHGWVRSQAPVSSVDFKVTMACYKRGI